MTCQAVIWLYNIVRGWGLFLLSYHCYIYKSKCQSVGHWLPNIPSVKNLITSLVRQFCIWKHEPEIKYIIAELKYWIWWANYSNALSTRPLFIGSSQVVWGSVYTAWLGRLHWTPWDHSHVMVLASSMTFPNGTVEAPAPLPSSVNGPTSTPYFKHWEAVGCAQKWSWVHYL